MFSLIAYFWTPPKTTSIAIVGSSGIKRNLVGWLVVVLLVSSANVTASLVSEDVTYLIGGVHDLRLENATFNTVSSGSFSGNTATVLPGSALSLSADWTLERNIDQFCPGCVTQIYLSWASAIPEFGGPSIECLHSGLPGSFPGTSLGPVGINREISAPTAPGAYEIGIGWDWNFDCGLSSPQAILGEDTTTGAGGYRSFLINVVTEINPVPAPAAVWLFGTALIGLVGFNKRRKAA